MINKTKGEKIFDFFNVIFLSLIVVVMVYPCLHVLFASFSDSTKILQHNGFLLHPIGFSFGAYEEVFKNQLIGTGYQNTLINLVIALALNISLTILGAYTLSRQELLVRRPIMLLITFTMFFNGGLIPNYMLVRNLGMTDTRWALIIPTAISAYNMIIMRTSFEAIPESLIESAKIDGAGEFTVLKDIALPVSVPVIAVIGLFYAVENWNAWFPAYIYLTSRKLWPIQLVLREIVISNDLSNMMTGVEAADMVAVGESIKYASIVVATVPILCVYPFIQKFFVKGVMIGAVKG